MKYFLVTLVLLGSLTTATYAQDVAAVERSSGFTIPAVRAWLTKQYEHIEIFRIKQAKHFTELRDTLKKDLHIEGKEIVFDFEVGVAGKDEVKTDTRSTASDNPFNYLKYVASISLATLFSESLVFYISFLLLGLLVVRFVVSRLV